MNGPDGPEGDNFPDCDIKAGKGYTSGKDVEGDTCQPCCKCDQVTSKCMIFSREGTDEELECGGGSIPLGGAASCAVACGV